MGHEIHIERDPPLSLDEWKAAVASTAMVRLDVSESRNTNPATGEVIAVPGIDGDAQANLNGQWVRCFRWRRGGDVTFKSDAGFESGESILRSLARTLATKLNAQVRGDDGELYE